jgi:hypothetical protein
MALSCQLNLKINYQAVMRDLKFSVSGCEGCCFLGCHVVWTCRNVRSFGVEE